MTLVPGKLSIRLDGSLQNFAFSPDGKKGVGTRWHDRYNTGRASMFIFDLATGEVTEPKIASSTVVTEPGSTWNDRGIIFSAGGFAPDADNDRACYWDGHAAHVLNSQVDKLQTWEPTWGPDYYAAERHHVIGDNAGPGQIVMAHLDNLPVVKALTAATRDCRQPCASHDGKAIVFQENVGDWNDEDRADWRLRIYDFATGLDHEIARGTDATFSNDGKRIVFSDTRGRLMVLDLESGKLAGVTVETRYSGAPSFSRDDQFIAYEGGPKGDDGGPPTAIYIAKAPSL